MISYLKEEISSSTDIYWFKSSNKYVVVDKKFSELLSLKLNDNDKFIKKINDSLDLSEKNYIEINTQMNEFISECVSTSNNKILKTEKISKTTEIDVKYTFNNKTIKVNFDSEMTKGLIDPKFLHLKSDEDYKIYKERLDHELNIIKEMKYSSYFLIVSDYIKWAKSNDIPVGPGRGSGAGSLVAWCLSITDIDPIKFNLIFERFLNPDRISMPDFDIDFCEEKRDLVFKYLTSKYKELVRILIKT